MSRSAGRGDGSGWSVSSQPAPHVRQRNSRRFEQVIEMACDPHAAHVVIGSSVSAGASASDVQPGVRTPAAGCAL